MGFVVSRLLTINAPYNIKDEKLLNIMLFQGEQKEKCIIAIIEYNFNVFAL